MKKQDSTVKNKHTDDLVDHYWGSISHIMGLIKSSELKAGLILSFYGILLNFMYQNVERAIDNLSNELFLFVLLGLWFLTAMVSIYFSIRSFIPRIEAKYEKNAFFFGDVISKYGDIREFSSTFYKISTDEEQLFDQLGQQIYINSKIASIKFKNVNRALRFLAFGLILLLLIVVYYVIITRF